MHLYPSSARCRSWALNKGGDVLDAKRAGMKAGGARPQAAPTGPQSGAGGKKFEAPAAKHDVAKMREGDGDDGKMGYAQRMELEEEKALKGWVENLPMMTIEGQPLSENVKKRRDARSRRRWTSAGRRGSKFEDTTWPQSPGARDRAPTSRAVYNKRLSRRRACRRDAVAAARGVCQQRRPALPRLAAGAAAADALQVAVGGGGHHPGGGDGQPLVRLALNIVSANRGQLDRIFFGEVDPTWVTYGFFVCKFYHDDPLSDDDWQVVLVDDRIPCDANGNPVFCRHPDQRTYWGMIIEKAYAKWAGSYEAMQGGTVTQGLEDLTGGIGYKFDLEKREKPWVHPDDRRCGTR